MEPLQISNTIQEFNGVRYYLCGDYFEQDGKSLHRVVFEHCFGPIPEGYHVHHKDENKSNNQSWNLETMLGSDHSRFHTTKRTDNRFPEGAREKAAIWHGSEDGKAWHSQQGKKNNLSMPTKEMSCEWCKKTVNVRAGNQHNFRFCSNACSTSERRASGIDNETRVCIFCGAEFVRNKYEKSDCCSKSCAANQRWKVIREKRGERPK